VAELQAKAQGAAFALELIRLVTPLLATLEKAVLGCRTVRFPPIASS
jgi:hypothetical protein